MKNETPKGVIETRQSRLMAAWPIYDNKDEMIDRYSVYLGEGFWLDINENGYCSHGEGVCPYELSEYAVLGPRVSLGAVPARVAAAIRHEASFYDRLSDAEFDQLITDLGGCV